MRFLFPITRIYYFVDFLFADSDEFAIFVPIILAAIDFAMFFDRAVDFSHGVKISYSSHN